MEAGRRHDTGRGGGGGQREGRGRERRHVPFLSQICKGLLPMLYRIERNPDWNVLRNIFIQVGVCILDKNGGRPPISERPKNQYIVVPPRPARARTVHFFPEPVFCAKTPGAAGFC